MTHQDPILVGAVPVFNLDDLTLAKGIEVNILELEDGLELAALIAGTDSSIQMEVILVMLGKDALVDLMVGHKPVMINKVIINSPDALASSSGRRAMLLRQPPLDPSIFTPVDDSTVCDPQAGAVLALQIHGHEGDVVRADWQNWFGVRRSLHIPEQLRSSRAKYVKSFKHRYLTMHEALKWVVEQSGTLLDPHMSALELVQQFFTSVSDFLPDEQLLAAGYLNEGENPGWEYYIKLEPDQWIRLTVADESFPSHRKAYYARFNSQTQDIEIITEQQRVDLWFGVERTIN